MLNRALALSLEKNGSHDYNTAFMSMGLGPASPQVSSEAQSPGLVFRQDQIPRMIIIHPPKSISRKLFESFLGYFFDQLLFLPFNF